MNASNKELKKGYQQSHRPMGVYQIRNLVNEKALIGKSLDLPGVLNRYRFQLQMGSHPNKALQADWQEFGADNFAFEILDELTPRQNPGYDYKEDLELLERMWLDNLRPFDDRGYNQKPESTDEKLWRIARNRLKKRDDDPE